MLHVMGIVNKRDEESTESTKQQQLSRLDYVSYLYVKDEKEKGIDELPTSLMTGKSLIDWRLQGPHRLRAEKETDFYLKKLFVVVIENKHCTVQYVHKTFR